MRALTPFVFVSAGAAMLVWSWRRWPDVLVDFGQQLYLPWRLAAGDVLYAGAFYIHGPLSQYFNSVVFRLFGTGVLQLALANLAITVGLVALLWQLLSRIADRWSATTGCLFFITVFATGQYIEVGNYNYITPYAHEVTHGLALSFAAIVCFGAFLTRRTRGTLGLSGLLTGLVFLTKAEVFLSLTLALAAGLGLSVWLRRPQSISRRGPIVATFCAAAVLPPLVSLALLSLRMSPHKALFATLGAWPHILAGAASGNLRSGQFYRWQMGTLNVGQSVEGMVLSLAWHPLVLAPGLLLAWRLARKGRNRRAWAALLAVSVVSLLLTRLDQIPWLSVPLSWPLILSGVVVVLLVHLLKERQTSEVFTRRLLRLVFAVFALGMLARMPLNTRIYHYGFAQAMPAAMVVIALLVSWLPTWLDQRKLYGRAVRLLAVAVIALMAFAHLTITRDRFAPKTHAVFAGTDQIRSDQRGVLVEQMLTQIRRRRSPDSTLAVFPEGVMLNYQARIPSSIPYTNFMPNSLLRFSEQQVLAALEAHPPQFIVLAHKDTSEFGARFFGRDYALALMRWISERYRFSTLVGSMPFRSTKFGLLLLEKR